jgi:hypothetical protein
MKASHIYCRALTGAACLCLVALVAACDLLPTGKSTPGKPTESEERAVREVFEGLKQKDRKRYMAGLITTADFIMRDNGLSDFHDQASYAGSILKPDEQKEQMEAFDTTLDPGPGAIDFANSSFESLGTVVRSDSFEILDGEKIPFNEWSVKIKTGGQTIDTKDLYPRFQVVEWNGGHKVLRLVLGASDYGSGGDPTDDAGDDDE